MFFTVRVTNPHVEAVTSPITFVLHLIDNIGARYFARFLEGAETDVTEYACNIGSAEAFGSAFSVATL